LRPFVLEVRIEAKSFGVPVLRNVVFSAERGDFLALLGPSGMGKSTTLRIVLGLDADFTGRVRLPPGRIAAVFQEPRLLPWLSLADNLRLVVTDNVPPPDIPALLGAVGLAGMEQHFPAQVSLGMARRVALARALAVSPQLLVLDEPFASLDPSLAATLSSLVARRARQSGMTALMATHDLDQALAMADRILVLSGHPATLAADEPVTGPRLRERLLENFPFLRPDLAVAPADEPLAATEAEEGS
jgi:ABC-type nitrate/sulfonate/bicarbonate transport system ATPase subunit